MCECEGCFFNFRALGVFAFGNYWRVWKCQELQELLGML